MAEQTISNHPGKATLLTTHFPSKGGEFRGKSRDGGHSEVVHPRISQRAVLWTLLGTKRSHFSNLLKDGLILNMKFVPQKLMKPFTGCSKSSARIPFPGPRPE